MADEDAKPTTSEEQATDSVEEKEATEAPEQTQEEAPQEEQAPEQIGTEEETEAQPAETGEQPKEDVPQMSRRKAQRLEKLESLVNRLRSSEEPPHPKPEGIDYRTMIDADDNVYEQLEAKSKEYGETQFNAGLEQAKSIQFHTRLEIDTPKIESKYPVFDQSSPEFNPAVASSINEWYLATVGFDPKTGYVQNPNLRYGQFVEGIMELADNMAGVKTETTVKNITQQAAQTGLRPGGQSERPMDLSKDPSRMTEEELKAAVATTMPLRDARGRFIKT